MLFAQKLLAPGPRQNITEMRHAVGPVLRALRTVPPEAGLEERHAMGVT